MKTKESLDTFHVPADRTRSGDSKLNSFISYFLPDECKVQTRSDLYRVATLVFIGLTFISVPFVIGAVYCGIESAKKGGSQ